MDKNDQNWEFNEYAGSSSCSESGGVCTVYMKDVSLRDWLAGQALTTIAKADTHYHPFSEDDCEIKAKWAYKMADAMLEKRKNSFYAEIEVESKLENENDYRQKRET